MLNRSIQGVYDMPRTTICCLMVLTCNRKRAIRGTHYGLIGGRRGLEVSNVVMAIGIEDMDIDYKLDTST